MSNIKVEITDASVQRGIVRLTTRKDLAILIACMLAAVALLYLCGATVPFNGRLSYLP